MKRLRSLTFVVPALVGCLGVAVICTGFLRQRSLAAETKLSELKGEAYREGTRLSGIVQHLSRKNLRQTADLEMSYASMSPDLILGLICDSTDAVRHATQLQWRDLQLADTPLAGLKSFFDDARKGMGGEVRISPDGGVISAVFPFFQKDGVSRAAIILSYDARTPVLEAQRAAVHESIAQGLALLAGCIVLWLLLDALVTRRIQSILTYARTVEEGSSAQMHVAGGDEIGVVAQSFASTVDQLRTTEQQVLEAGELERRRVGRDLHDDVCQRITAAQLKVGVLGSALKKEGSAHHTRAMEVAGELSKAAEIARGCARGLAPGALESDGLDQALEDLAAHISNLFSVNATSRSSPEVNSVDKAVQVHLFRIAQELATNAAKHAQSSLIKICCEAEPGLLRLEVENDGLPFKESSATRGLGLELVRQRVRAIGGLLQFQPREGDQPGTLAICEVPLPSSN